MIRYLARRLLSMAAVMVGLSLMVFLIFFATPGVDPARQMAGKNPDADTIAAIEREFGLDQPLPVQYVRMLERLVISRDLESYTNRGVRVIPELLRAAPVTLSLVLGATVIWLTFSILLGTAAAAFPRSPVDRGLTALALVGLSLPVFWVGQVANILTQDAWRDTFLFGWVPPLGYTSFFEDPLLWFRHLVIPWCVLALTYTGLYGRVLRSALLEAEHEDFVRTARAKGISERRVLVRHRLRVSLVAYMSLFALDFGALAGGSALLVEVVFGLPGVGNLAYRALTGLDLPVIMAAVLYSAFFVVLMSALADLVHAWLDPRMRDA